MGSQQIIWLFFGISGRLSRLAYFLAGMFLAIVQAFFLYRVMLAQEAGLPGGVWENGFAVTFFISLWANVALGVKRLHDFDRPGIMAAALFIPIVSILAFVALCVFPGDPGPNKYGQQTNSPS